MQRVYLSLPLLLSQKYNLYTLFCYLHKSRANVHIGYAESRAAFVRRTHNKHVGRLPKPHTYTTIKQAETEIIMIIGRFGYNDLSADVAWPTNVCVRCAMCGRDIVFVVFACAPHLILGCDFNPNIDAVSHHTMASIGDPSTQSRKHLLHEPSRPQIAHQPHSTPLRVNPR